MLLDITTGFMGQDPLSCFHPYMGHAGPTLFIQVILKHHGCWAVVLGLGYWKIYTKSLSHLFLLFTSDDPSYPSFFVFF